MDRRRCGTRRTRVVWRENDRAWAALAVADPDVHAGDHRFEGLKNTLNQQDSLSHPVPAGSRLRGRVAVTAAEDVPPDALRVTYNVSIEIEGGKCPACVAEVIGQHYR